VASVAALTELAALRPGDAVVVDDVLAPPSLPTIIDELDFGYWWPTEIDWRQASGAFKRGVSLGWRSGHAQDDRGLVVLAKRIFNHCIRLRDLRVDIEDLVRYPRDHHCPKALPGNDAVLGMRCLHCPHCDVLGLCADLLRRLGPS
jgi:hypothetical protein